MKKHACVPVLVLCILLLLCSCFTTRNTNEDISEEDANQAMYVVLTKAINNANTRFFQKVNSYSFFPSEYNVILESKDSIPGMNTIIDSWNSYVANYLTENREKIESQTSSSVGKLQIKNGFALIEKSNTSGTEYLDIFAKEDFIELLTSLVNAMNFSKLNVAVSQYNAWVKTQNYSNNTKLSSLEVKDVSNELITFIYETFKNTVAMYEELYRTTPDPYTEDIILKVFGLS